MLRAEEETITVSEVRLFFVGLGAVLVFAGICHAWRSQASVSSMGRMWMDLNLNPPRRAAGEAPDGDQQLERQVGTTPGTLPTTGTATYPVPLALAPSISTPLTALPVTRSHLLNCSGTVIPVPIKRNRLWLCPLTRNFTADEETVLKQLIDDGTLVPSSSTISAGVPNRTMRALYDGLWVPAPEPLLKPVGNKEIDLISKKARCLRRKFADSKNDAVNFRVEACAIVRNRVKLVVEWIQYNRILGVEFFHIFDDHSVDGLREALEPFIKKGVVKLDAMPPPPVKFLGVELGIPAKQLGAMSGCIEHARERQAKDPGKGHIWQMMFDTDEFLMYGGCVGDLIRHTMEQVGDPRKVGGVAVGWIWQGHAFEHKDTFRSQFERIRYKLGPLLSHFKTIVRVDLVVPFGPGVPMTPHGFKFAPPAVSYYQSGVPSGAILQKSAKKHYTKGDGLLVHFHTRSLASYLQRMSDGRAGHVERPVESMTLNEIVGGMWTTAKLYINRDNNTACGIYWYNFQELYRLLLRGLGHHNISVVANEAERKDTFPIERETIAFWTSETVRRKRWPSFVDARG